MPADRTSHLVAALPDESGRPKSFYRSFMNFLFSNLGLVIIVIAYCIGGAFLFTLLEQYIELQNCQQGNCKSAGILILTNLFSLSLILFSEREYLHLESVRNDVQLRGHHR